MNVAARTLSQSGGKVGISWEGLGGLAQRVSTDSSQICK